MFNQKTNFTLSALLVLFALTSPIVSANYGFPTIGILTTHDKRFHDKERFFELTAFSFVAKSYTQWVEQTGAMPVLIPFDSELKTLDFLLENVQGLIIQSGKVHYLDKKGKPSLYQKRVSHALHKAMEINKKKYYPVIVEGWSVQGFVNTFTDNNTKLLSSKLGEEKRANSVETTDNFKDSHFFGKMDSDVYEKVFNKKLLYFSTEHGYSKDDLEGNDKFKKEIMVTATSKTKKDREFVSMMEHKKYPILATVFLTERTQFERHGPNTFLPRDQHVINYSFQFMMSIVDQLRDAAHRLDRQDGEVRAYFTNYYMPERGAWDEIEQAYMFNRLEMDEDAPKTFNE
jgi:hypothetical protein